MAIDAATKSKTPASVRAALAAELPEHAWAEVRGLLGDIDDAVAEDDANKVSDIAAALDTIRFQHDERAPSPRAEPEFAAAAGKASLPARSPRVRRAVVAVSVALGVVLVVALALAGFDVGDDEASYDPAPATTTRKSPAPPGRAMDVPLDSDGDLTITLTWTTRADLDLSVEEPDGTLIDAEARGPSRSGGIHAGDGNSECAPTGSEETVSWPSRAPPGSYEVSVAGYRVAACGSGNYTLTIQSGPFSTERLGRVADGATDRTAF